MRKAEPSRDRALEKLSFSDSPLVEGPLFLASPRASQKRFEPGYFGNTFDAASGPSALSPAGSPFSLRMYAVIGQS